MLEQSKAKSVVKFILSYNCIINFQTFSFAIVHWPWIVLIYLFVFIIIYIYCAYFRCWLLVISNRPKTTRKLSERYPAIRIAVRISTTFCCFEKTLYLGLVASYLHLMDSNVETTQLAGALPWLKSNETDFYFFYNVQWCNLICIWDVCYKNVSLSENENI